MQNDGGTLQHAYQLMVSGRAGEALNVLRPLAEARRLDGPVHTVMTAILMRLGRPAEAAVYAERALRATPDSPDAVSNLGNALIGSGRVGEAVALLEPAVARWPAHLNLLVTLSYAQFLDGRYGAAAATARSGLARSPQHPKLAGNLSAALLYRGQADEAVAVLREAMRSAPGDAVLCNGLCQALNYAEATSPEETLAAHVAFGRILDTGMPPPPRAYANSRDESRPLRVGLLSSDLCHHSVAYFIEPVLTTVRDGAQVVCYSTGPEDEVSARLRALASGWRSCGSLAPGELAAQITADGIDVLLELNGHTSGHRLQAVHLRPAPVQVTYLGYPNTTGLRGVHYRMVDAVTDPPGSEAWCSEALARIEPCFLCYQPPAHVPEVRGRDPSRPLSFGSLNTMQKWSPGVIRAWAAALAASPGSVLVLKSFGLRQPEERDAARARLGAAGIAAERVELLEPAPTPAEHLAAYERIDVSLDTFPYAGTTTTCESLLMGVPVVTVEGAVHRGRVGASLLKAVGLPELVAHDQEEYVRLATDLGGDRGRLAELRGSLRSRLMDSPVCDAERFGRAFWGTIRQLWAKWCRESRSGGS